MSFRRLTSPLAARDSPPKCCLDIPFWLNNLTSNGRYLLLFHFTCGRLIPCLYILCCCCCIPNAMWWQHGAMGDGSFLSAPGSGIRGKTRSGFTLTWIELLNDDLDWTLERWNTWTGLWDWTTHLHMTESEWHRWESESRLHTLQMRFSQLLESGWWFWCNWPIWNCRWHQHAAS